MDVCTAFAFVLNASTTRKYVGSISLTQETQVSFCTSCIFSTSFSGSLLLLNYVITPICLQIFYIPALVSWLIGLRFHLY